MSDAMNVMKIKKGMIVETSHGIRTVRTCNPGTGPFYRLTFEKSDEVCICPYWFEFVIVRPSKETTP